MEVEGWKYYKHAAVPTCAPHESANIKIIKNKKIWKIRKALFARWTSNFDCGYETNWWYIIKDTPFDVKQLKAKRRYEITKGNRNFKVKKINPKEYKKEMFDISSEVYETYPARYRPIIDEKVFYRTIDDWKENIVTYGAFDQEERMCAYAWLALHKSYADFCVLKAKIESEKYGVNAAILAFILEDFADKLKKQDFYICDGARNILHETSFQDYLEKYFNFRRAYCTLHIIYRFPFGLLVKILYPFRNKISEKGKITGKIRAVLKMEEIKNEESDKERA